MALVVNRADYVPPTPKQTGIVEFKNVPIAELRKFIDWSPFFRIWGLMGGYPDALIILKVAKKHVKVERCSGF